MYDYTANYYENNDNTSRSITDLDYAFGIHPISKDIRKKTNIEAIKQSIKTLVLLNHYEKPFHPDIGCDIYKSMFEPFDDIGSEDIMKGFITKVIQNYEPRAELQNIEVQNDPDNNRIGITIWFIPVGEVTATNVDIFLRILR